MLTLAGFQMLINRAESVLGQHNVWAFGRIYGVVKWTRTRFTLFVFTNISPVLASRSSALWVGSLHFHEPVSDSRFAWSWGCLPPPTMPNKFVECLCFNHENLVQSGLGYNINQDAPKKVKDAMKLINEYEKTQKQKTRK
eukprot:Lithocolla_globosa_v1_NODE_2880_length_1836_cov_108.358787.p2 type:complete len:140 gc:universal NODE_2880_length_1836_cov_108.358787:1051-632(-)